MKKIFIFILFLLLRINANAQCWQSASNSGSMGTGIKTDGTLWVWGDIVAENLNNYTDHPIQVGTDNDWKSVSTGLSFRAAIKNNGTLWTWGSQSGGHLGDGVTALGNIYVSQPTQVGTDTNWKSVDCNSSGHTLAIKSNGTLWVWGVGYSGAFGFPYTSSYLGIPTQIGTDTDWKFATVGFSGAGSPGYYSSTSMAIKTNGSLWGWGNNAGGQLGDGTTNSKSVPTLIDSTNNWVNVSTADNHTLAIKSDGTLWACGYNFEGQLGDGTTTTRTSLTQIGTDNHWQSVNTSYYHSLGTKTDGTLWAWGDNLKSVLGTGNDVDSLIPLQIGTDTNWSKVSASKAISQVLKTDGSLWSWGSNYHNALGIGPIPGGIRSYPGQLSCTALNTQTVSAIRFTIFPNPVKDILHIQNSQDITIIKTCIYDISGKKITEIKDNSTQINIGQFEKGVYLIKIFTADGIHQEKVIKE